MQPLDVVIAGSGPAGCALARALARRDLRVAVVAPGPPTHTLALFDDERGDWPARSVARRTVVEADGARRDLERPYAVLDNARLPEALPSSVAVWRDRVRGVVGRTAGEVLDVRLEGGGSLPTRVVVDCASGALTRRHAGAPAFQSALGRIVDASLPGLDAQDALLMDWDSLDEDGPPSFLYAIPLGDGRALLEETVLCARPALPPAALAARLGRRLARLGVKRGAALAEEHVVIPMGGGLPLRGQRVAAFGAAAGLVHPVTGYSAAASLRLADRAAAALHAALARGAHAPDALLDALWDGAARARHVVLRVALEAAVRFDAVTARRFFARFFALPPSQWHAFLAGAAAPAALRAVGRSLYRGADPRLRRALLRGALTAAGPAVLIGALGDLLPGRGIEAPHRQGAG